MSTSLSIYLYSIYIYNKIGVRRSSFFFPFYPFVYINMSIFPNLYDICMIFVAFSLPNSLFFSLPDSLFFSLPDSLFFSLPDSLRNLRQSLALSASLGELKKKVGFSQPKRNRQKVFSLSLSDFRFLSDFWFSLFPIFFLSFWFLISFSSLIPFPISGVFYFRFSFFIFLFWFLFQFPEFLISFIDRGGNKRLLDDFTSLCITKAP